MKTIAMRPFAGSKDLQAIVDFLNLCETVDQVEEGTSIAELQQEFSAPGFDVARDMQLWQDSEGYLIGYGEIWIPGASGDGFLRFHVHPDWRNQRLARQIICWAETRLKQVAQERRIPANLYVSPRDSQIDQIAALESYGFTTTRYFFSMGRSLNEPLPEPQLPAGFTLRHGVTKQEVGAWVEMHNQSFIDHWNHHEMTVEERLHEVSDAEYQPELDLVAIAPDSTFAAYCYCCIRERNNARTQRNEGWIAILGTRRGFRRRGLGRAMLLSGLHRLKQAGVEAARLGVDAENPSGALRLYESVGFHKVHTRFVYRKHL